MAKDHSSFSIQRKNSNKLSLGKFILFVEGRNTEYSYFKQIKKSNCRIESVTVRGNGISSCVDFVNTSIAKFNNYPAKKRAKYTEKWLIFDFDGHNDFTDAIKLARANGFGVAFSSMCIEYWFLLHFENHNGSPIPMKGDSHSQAQIDLLNKHIERYNRTNHDKPSVKLYDSDSKAVEDDFYDLMLAIDPTTHKRRIINALERAKRIHELKKSQGAEFRESVTTIYELLLHLGVFDRNPETGEYSVYFKA